MSSLTAGEHRPQPTRTDTDDHEDGRRARRARKPARRAGAARAKVAAGRAAARGEGRGDAGHGGAERGGAVHADAGQADAGQADGAASELAAGAGEAIAPGPASDGAPLLRATPMRLAFPPTRAGDVSETRTVLVTNATAAPLALVDAIAHGAQGDAFQVVGIDDTWLAPGAGTRLHVVFRPGASGTHRGFCTVETEDGLGLSIPLLGRGRPSLVADLAGGDPAARAEALDRIDAGLRAELARQAASGAPIALGPTYREMELAFELAVEAARDGHTARARALAEALRAVFAQVASRDRVTAVFQERDIALQAPIAMWAFASDAVRDLAVRVGSDRLPPAVGAQLLERFRVGRAVIELATGESRDASTFDEFDRASLLTTGVVSALPLAAIVVVAAPEAVGAAWARLAPMLVSEAGTLWFATRTLWAGLRVLVNATPRSRWPGPSWWCRSRSTSARTGTTATSTSIA